MNAEAIRQARIDLAAIFRWSARMGLGEGICNHFSFAPDRESFLVNPRGWHWSELTASRLLLVDSDHKLVEGEGEVEPSAFFIHSQVHQRLAQARCVLHTHMPFATAIAASEGGRLHMASQNSVRFFDDIAYEDEYEGLALDATEGERICRALGGKHIAFLANHGVIVVGETIAKAFAALYYLERASYLQYLVQSASQSLKLVDDRIARLTRQQFIDDPRLGTDHLAAIRRILEREEPDYAT